MTKTVTVIDYGIGNIYSVCRAFEACGANVLLTDSPEEISSASHLVLPGVGAFVDGMRELSDRGLVDPLRIAFASGKPVLGICLGMQMLFSESDEHTLTHGLGIIPGRVEAIENQRNDGGWRKTPHIGWAELLVPKGQQNESTLLFDGLEKNPFGYFVHSYACVPNDRSSVIRECEYEGVRISAAVRQGNVFGCQFHPEKSGELGLQIINNFLNI